MINENNAALGGEALDQKLSVDRWERGLLLIDECLNSDKMSSFAKWIMIHNIMKNPAPAKEDHIKWAREAIDALEAAG